MVFLIHTTHELQMFVCFYFLLLVSDLHVDHHQVDKYRYRTNSAAGEPPAPTFTIKNPLDIFTYLMKNSIMKNSIDIYDFLVDFYYSRFGYNI